MSHHAFSRQHEEKTPGPDNPTAKSINRFHEYRHPTDLAAGSSAYPHRRSGLGPYRRRDQYRVRVRFLAPDPRVGPRRCHGGCRHVGRFPWRACNLNPSGRFPAGHGYGGALGIIGVPLPIVETGIALSGVVLGLLVAFAVRAPIWVAAVIVGVFSVFHGHAHGAELPEAFSAYGYAVGFVVGTGIWRVTGSGI